MTALAVGHAGFEISTSTAHVKRIDERNDNTLWPDAINKEMDSVAIAFQVLETDDPIPVGWSKSSGHLVLDVKMDFTRKARWVKDGHRTPDPTNPTFAGVVSRERVQIALTYAALNKGNICVADILISKRLRPRDIILSVVLSSVLKILEKEL